VIKFFVLDALTPTAIHSKLLKVYKDASPSLSTVKKWTTLLKSGCT
ncbi:hypothetical protein EAI_13536, partial [Harpegnathos saltator]